MRIKEHGLKAYNAIYSFGFGFMGGQTREQHAEKAATGHLSYYWFSLPESKAHQKNHDERQNCRRKKKWSLNR